MTPADDRVSRAGRVLPSGVLLATVGVLVVVMLGLLLMVDGLRTENAALATERDLAEVAGKTARAQLTERSLVAEQMINELGRQLREAGNLSRLKITALTPPPGTAPDSAGIVVWDQANQTGLLTVQKLPPNSDDDDYQLWIADSASGPPVNGGVFHIGFGGVVARNFVPGHPLTAVVFSVSREKKGGTKSAPGPIVLVSGH
jgi:hypothetical protein